MKVRHAMRALAGGLVLCAGLAACGPREEILSGTRLELRTPLDAADGATAPAAANRAVALALPAPVNLAEWTHPGGGPQHRAPHAALNSTLTRVFGTGIGAGSDRRNRISAAPVVAGGRVFTLDALAGVAATSTAGAPLWSRDLTPARDGATDASGGGLAFGEGRLFVTTGFGTLAALDPATGAVLWTQAFDAPVTAAPTVSGGQVFVVAQDSTAWALDPATGRVKWQLPGTPPVASVVGGPGPAVTDRLVVLPYATGEMAGALLQGGIRVWSAYVVGQRLGRAYAAYPAITGGPVVAGDTIYAGSQAGRLVALDAADGTQLWAAREGALGPVVPVGGALFMISDEAKLVRLDAATGETVWAVDLPYFEDDKPKRFKAIYAHYGPVLAGGRLIVASSDGLIRLFDPVSGALTGSVALPGGAAAAPVVAGGALYVVSPDGVLHGYR